MQDLIKIAVPELRQYLESNEKKERPEPQQKENMLNIPETSNSQDLD